MPDLARLVAVARVLNSLRRAPPHLACPDETLPFAGPVGRSKRLADIYVPEAPCGASVLIVHGGGFLVGSRDMKPVRVLATDLVAAGVTVCAVDYRKPPHGRLPAMRDDVILAMFWWFEEIGRRGLDRDRFDLMGLSAGGTLACLANEVAPEHTVRQLLLGFPLLDIEALDGAGVNLIARGLFPGGDRSRFSPVVQCRSKTPVVIHQGTADLLVTDAVVHRAVQGMRARGASVVVHRYDGAPHGLFNAPDREWAKLARRRMVEAVTNGPEPRPAG